MSNKSFQPMLSATIGKGYSSKHANRELAGAIHQHLDIMVRQSEGKPIYTSPKLDGIRVFIHPKLGVVTRTLKPIPNQWIASRLFQYTDLHGCDGEIIVGNPNDRDVFNRTQSFVMTEYAANSIPDSRTPFKFHVFDHHNIYQGDTPVATYAVRYNKLRSMFKHARHYQFSFLNVAELLNQHPCYTVQDIVDQDALNVHDGYEGTMLRLAASGYKYGRATPNDVWLGKLKQFEDAEGIIVGVEELESNQNEATIDARGLTKRSSHLSGMVPMNTLGKLRVKVTGGEFDGVEVRIGTGFTAEQRQDLWNQWHNGSDVGGGGLLNVPITFKYQSYGSKNAPRMPIFKGFRKDHL